MAAGGSSLADVDAAARAAGNRKPAAVAIGRRLFAKLRPVQLLKVRVDGVGTHEIAGLVLSGVKFHAPVDARGFASEVADLVAETFAASPVEEVDVWATVPLKVGQRAIVAGDKAEPTTRIVYGLTVRRGDGRALQSASGAERNAYWDAAWKAGLQAPRHAYATEYGPFLAGAGVRIVPEVHLTQWNTGDYRSDAARPLRIARNLGRRRQRRGDAAAARCVAPGRAHAFQRYS